MKQVTRKKIQNKSQNKSKKEIVTKKTAKNKKHHPQYGTSKLEEDFAKEFLDKLGVKYIYQFEAKDIKRYFDFFLNEKNLLIEVDGDYW